MEVRSLYTLFVGSFYHKWILNFVKNFFALIEMIMTFILHFVNMMFHIDQFADVKPSLQPWDKSRLIMMSDSLMNNIIELGLLTFF